MMARDRIHFLFLNIGHFLDHLLTLVFATVAALALVREWGLSYDALIRYAMPGFVAFGVFALPAGWLADRWSREGMMVVYFVGTGVSACLTSFARNPIEMSLGLFMIGVFAAIYHPVGLAMVVQRFAKTGLALGINGIWGNFGVGGAALITGFLIDHWGWRAAFFIPGGVCVLMGLVYLAFAWPELKHREVKVAAPNRVAEPKLGADERRTLWHLTAVVFITTALSGIVFQSTTFALPKVMEERLADLGGTATTVGLTTFFIFAIAALAQLLVGFSLDRFGPRNVFLIATLVQAVFFALMPGQTGWSAVFVGLAFMLGAFGQIPINDYMIGKFSKGELRASIYGLRYVVTFAVLGAAIPLISLVHERWGFDMLFRILSAVAALIFVIVLTLPGRMPEFGARPIPSPAPAGE